MRHWPLLALVLLLPGTSVVAETAAEMLANAHILGYAPNLEIRAEMQLLDRGAPQRRTIQVFLQRQDDGRTRIFTQILLPPFLQSMKFLQYQSPDGEQDRWMSTSRGVRRLGVRDAAEHLFNSDFTTDDFSYLDVEGHELSIVERAGQLVTINERAPSRRERLITVDTAKKLIVAVDYRNESGKTEREYRVEETGSVNGIWYPRVSKMTDLTSETSTRLTIERIEAVDSIPDRIFSRGNL